MDIFTEKAVDVIYGYTSGAARGINKICTHCLMSGAQQKKKLVDDHLVRTVIEGEMP